MILHILGHTPKLDPSKVVDKTQLSKLRDKMPGAQTLALSYGGVPSGSPGVGARGHPGVDRLTESHGDLIKTDSPNFLCTPLPQHWRVNKSLQTPFKGKAYLLHRRQDSLASNALERKPNELKFSS